MVEFKLGPMNGVDSDPSSPSVSEDEEIKPVYDPRTNRNVRHYKKDSRYLLDLYTLTFDEDQTVEKLKTRSNYAIPDFRSKRMDFEDNRYRRSQNETHNSGPVSLQVDPRQNFYPSSLPCLETNLHKILARKIHDSEDISFNKTKLLTKAYYQILQDLNVNDNISSLKKSPKSKIKPPPMDLRIPWHTLISSDVPELTRIVNGLTNSAKALNEYLVDILIERDDLAARQDDMLEQIGELTDRLL